MNPTILTTEMTSAMTVVPFKAEAFHGFAKAHGMLRWEESGIHVQFEIADSITGLVKQTIKFKIPTHLIDQVEFTKGWFRSNLTVRVREMDVIEQVAWREGPEFQVAIARSDRDAAVQFAEEVKWSLD